MITFEAFRTGFGLKQVIIEVEDSESGFEGFVQGDYDKDTLPALIKDVQSFLNELIHYEEILND